MSFDRDDRFPPFFVGDHDRLTIRFETSQKAYRLIQTSHDSVILKAEEGPHLCETFTFRRLRELERAGKIGHEVEYFLPPEMRSPPARGMTDMAMPRLNPKHRARVDLRYAYAQALIDLQNNPDEEQRVGKGDEHIAANMGRSARPRPNISARTCPPLKRRRTSASSPRAASASPAATSPSPCRRRSTRPPCANGPRSCGAGASRR